MRRLRRWAPGVVLSLLLVGASGEKDVPEADTAGWKVVFSDKFDRKEIGEGWKTITGDWTIDEGAIRGELKGPEGSEFRGADIVLTKLVLPKSFELTYETWFPVELGSEVKVLSEDNDHGFFAIVMGTDGPYLKKGTTVMHHKDKDSYNPIDQNAKADVSIDKHHKMRLVYHEDGISLYQDGRRVSAARLPDVKTFGPLKVHLVGTWGGESSLIYFDNLEVRAPK